MYDAASKTLTVKHDHKDSTFQVADQAQVMKGTQKADASSLAASTGQAVKVEYTMDGATKLADKIEIEVAAAHAGRAAAPKKK